MTDHSLTRFLAAGGEADVDPAETAEWRDAFLALVATEGPQRARFVLDELVRLARSAQVDWTPELVTPYVNTIPVDRQPAFPGDLAIEEKLASLMRWPAGTEPSGGSGHPRALWLSLMRSSGVSR